MRLKLVLPLLVLVGLVGAFWYGLHHDPRVVPSPLIGKPAPAFELADLADPSGAARIRSADLAGKVWLLNVWGSWCVGCVQEHPVLVALAQRKLLPIIGLDWKDEAQAARSLLAERGDPYDRVAFDPVGRTAIDYGVYGAPESFLIDGQGVIRYKFIGPLTDDDVERVLVPLVASLGGGAVR